MIKIAFVIDAIYTPTGGTEKQLLLLIKNLDRKKYAPTLCVLKPSEWVEKEFDACPLYIIGIDTWRKPATFAKLWNFTFFLKNEGFDIVQTYFFDANVLGILASKWAGVKRVVSTRRNQSYFSNLKQKRVLRLLNPLVHHFVSNSFSTSGLISKYERIPKTKISVIYNALQLESFKLVPANTRSSYRKDLGIEDANLVVGIVANLREIKGIDVFLKAAKKILECRNDVQFIIVGAGANDGVEETRLRRLSDYLGLDDNVRFLGMRMDIPELLVTFDIAVLTSKSEGFSNSLVEYIATGLPIVTTDVGGAREAVTEGVNGFIVPINDYCAISNAIMKIAHGCLDKNDLIVKQQEAHHIYSLQQSIKAYQELYDTLLLS